jgi:hypothetical protein
MKVHTFEANFLISLIARGARFLNPLSRRRTQREGEREARVSLRRDVTYDPIRIESA